MEPNAVIESYVANVVRRIPRRQRRDVGFELRSLLSEELIGRADELGRPADEAMALDLLAAFGRPQDVADRYRPSGFTVIRPSDAPAFAWLALGGVALQWALTLPGVFTSAADVDGPVAAVSGSDHWLTLLGSWWLSWGLGAFWWPGFLISFALIAGMIRHRRADATTGAAGPDADADTGERTAARSIPRSVLDPDRVNRPGLALAIGFWAIGATVLIALPWLPTLAPGLPQPVLNALALDPDFLSWRAPWLLVLWTATFAVEIAELVAGRTTKATRRISIAVGACSLALLTWYLAAGPIFEDPTADSVAQFCLVIVMVIIVIDLIVTIRREAVSTRAPVV